MATVTPWREWLAPQREKLRASPTRTAWFLIAVYVLIELQSQFVSWEALRPRRHLVQLEAIDGFTWDWVREHSIAVLESSGLSALWWNLGSLVGIAICLIATAWFFGLTWKQTMVKLGLPKPKRVEFTIPMIACVPVISMIVLVLWPRTDFTVIDQPVFLMPSITGVLIGAFGVLVPMGFLYRGLVQDAKWSPTRSLVTLMLASTLTILPSFFPLEGFLEVYSLTMVLSLTALAILITWSTAWLLGRWRFRLWCLVFLALGTSLTRALVPTDWSLDSPVVNYVAWLAPTLLLLAWTGLNLSNRSTPATTIEGRAHA